METEDAMHAYYNQDRERDRLASGRGELEFVRTIEIVTRTLPAPPAVVADIGGGPGRYSDWLIEQGYTVIHRDVVPDHVKQMRDRHRTQVDTAVGDARDLSDIATGCADAVLLLGPLYHLSSSADRARVISETARITRVGGMVYAAAITRWATRIMALLVDRIYLHHPKTIALIDQVDATGVLEPVIDGGFTAFAHTPEQFAAEVGMSGLKLESVLGIEGIATAFTAEDVTERLADATDRKVLLDSLRALEAVPDLLGASSHLLAIARRT